MHWGSSDRTVTVGARRTSTLLVVHENTNPGWQATLNGRPLPRITVDGWQQGYVLPPGPAATVHLTYPPDRLYRAALLGGAVAVLLLLILAVRRPRPPRARHRGARIRWGRDLALAAIAVAAVLGLGAVAVVAVLAVLWWLRPAQWRAWLGTAVPAVGALAVAILTCGVAGAVVWALVLAVALTVDARSAVAPFLRRAMAVVAAGCYLGAGVVLALHHWGEPDYAAGTSTVQLLSLTAVLAVLLASVRAPWTVSRGAGPAPTSAAPSPAAPPDGR
jgi:hypothetical protein